MGENLYSLGEKYYIDRNYKKAYELFKSSYEKGEDVYDSLNYMGCCQLNLGNYADAIKLFDKVIENNTTWERPIFNKGRVFLKLENYSEALAYFNKALIINPENEDVYFYLGRFYEETNEYDKAEQYYKKSLEICDEQPETHLSLGLVYFHMEKLDSALLEFDKVIQEYSNVPTETQIFIDALKDKGLVLTKAERFDDALIAYRKAHELSPDDLKAMHGLAHAYYKLGDFNNSIHWVEKVLAKNPDYTLSNKLKKALLSKIKKS